MRGWLRVVKMGRVKGGKWGGWLRVGKKGEGYGWKKEYGYGWGKEGRL